MPPIIETPIRAELRADISESLNAWSPLLPDTARGGVGGLWSRVMPEWDARFAEPRIRGIANIRR